jgi:dGTPase
MEAGILNPGDIPIMILKTFGETAESRKNAIIQDLLKNTRERDNTLYLSFSKGMEEEMDTLREFLYKNVYRSELVNQQMETGVKIIKTIYEAIMTKDELYKELPQRHLADTRAEAALDFIAGMTDRFAVKYAEKLSS